MLNWWWYYHIWLNLNSISFWSPGTVPKVHSAVALQGIPVGAAAVAPLLAHSLPAAGQPRARQWSTLTWFSATLRYWAGCPEGKSPWSPSQDARWINLTAATLLPLSSPCWVPAVMSYDGQSFNDCHRLIADCQSSWLIMSRYLNLHHEGAGPAALH